MNLLLGCVFGPLFLVLGVFSMFTDTGGLHISDRSVQTGLDRFLFVLMALFLSMLSFAYVLYFRHRVEARPIIKYAYIGIVFGMALALAYPVAGPLAAVALILLLWWWERRRIPPGHCRTCGYNLTGNVSGRCPECGSPVPSDLDAPPKPSLPELGQLFRGQKRMLIGVVVLLFTWSGATLLYTKTDWPALLSDQWLQRLCPIVGYRAMSELLSRFANGQLDPADARRLFNELASVSLTADSPQSAGDGVMVELRVISVGFDDMLRLRIEEFQVLVDGRVATVRLAGTHMGVTVRDGYSLDGYLCQKFEMLVVKAGTHEVNVRATVSWQPGIMAGVGGRPLKSRYGWLINELITIVVTK